MKKFLVATLVACVCAVASFVNAQEDQPLNQLTPLEEKLGFELLFDGNSLSPEIWQSGIDGYPVKDGYFVCEKGGNLETKKAYSDFIFRFEFKLPKNGNNGVGIRTTAANLDAAYNGMEIQIIDEDYPGIAEWQRHGSIYGVVPAKTGALKPIGEWNYEEIVAIGPQIKVTVNGKVIVDADITNAKPIHNAEHPGLHNKSGFIGFLGHGDPVEFRNVRILSLAKDEPAATDAAAPATPSVNGITLAQAKSIALAHAKLAASDVTFTKAGEEIDDGVRKFEVEFYHGQIEYDYDIDAKTGAILSFDQDAESFAPTAAPAADNGAEITVEKAKEIALAHAKLAAGAVTFTKAQKELDDGVWKYEIEFYAGQTEYDYDIDVKTGAILSFDQDAESYVPAPAANAGEITLEKAKEIALAHAKLAANAVTFTKAQKELDDGVWKYEIEFYAGQTEYDYDIDVKTGAILSFDQDAESYVPAPAPAANNGAGITEQQALQIALKDAKVAQNAISRTRIKRDRENGRNVFEVEFHVGRTEYNYDIDATTGAIVERDVDNDD